MSISTYFFHRICLKFIFFIFFFLFFQRSNCFGQQLIITEVYIDGTDEWIELVNIGDEFVGDITIHGVKSSPLVVPIHLMNEEVLLLGDQMEIITVSLPKTQDLGFSLNDTNALKIDIYVDTILIDTFEVNQTEVEEINNTHTSLERNCTSSCVYVPSTSMLGIASGYTASPGVRTYILPIETETGAMSGSNENIGSGDTLTGSISTGGTSLSTGVLLTGGESPPITGQTLTGEVLFSGGLLSGTISSGSTMPPEEYEPPPPPSIFSWGDIKITEIHPNDTDVLGEYIIIESSISYTGPLRFIGLGQGVTEKIVNVSLLPGDRLIITDTIEHISSGESWYTFPSITLTNGGETIDLYIDDVRLDYVDFSSVENGSVLLYTETINAIRQFLTKSSSSVVLEDMDTITCDISTEVVGHTNDNKVIYNLLLSPSDPIYCSNWYTPQWLVNDTTYVGCSITTELPAGQHFISSSLYNQATPLCSSFISLYNYLPDIGGTGHSTSGGNTLTITEIYPRDDTTFSEYIELSSDAGYQGTITIGGLGHGGAEKSFVVDLGSGERMIVSDDPENYFPDTKHLILPTISLTNDGEQLTIYRQDGHVIDNLVYTKGVSGKSLYYTSSSGALDQFFTTEVPTPGFTYEQIKFLVEKDEAHPVISCGVKLQHTTPLFEGNKINLIAQVDEADIQNSSSTYMCERDFPGTSYVFTGGCNPSYYAYDLEGIHRVGVYITNTNDTTICHATLDINYPSKSSPTGGSNDSGDTYYQGLYKKRKERFETLKGEIKTLGYSVTTSGYVLISNSSSETFELATGVLEITQVIPNPKGSDTEREQITIKNLTPIDIDTEGYRLYNGTSRKSLPSTTLIANQETTIVGNLGLTNRATCIQLQQGDTTYDIFCYPEAKDDAIFTSSLTGLESKFSTEGIDTSLKNLALTLEHDQACIFFNKESMLCKGFDYTHEEVKQWKKDAKKYTTIAGHLEDETTRANNRRSKYKEQVAKRKVDASYYTGRLTKEKASTDRYRKQQQVHSSFAHLLIQELQTNRGPLFRGSDLAVYTTSYQETISLLRDNSFYYTYHGIDVPVEELEDIIALTHHQALPLQQKNIIDIYLSTFEESKSTLASFLENLRKDE